MNRYQIRSQFGRKPKLESVILFSVQQALKGYRVTHPDSKRQPKAKARDLEFKGSRRIKTIVRTTFL